MQQEKFESIRVYAETKRKVEKLRDKYNASMAQLTEAVFDYISKAGINPILENPTEKEKRFKSIEIQVERLKNQTLQRFNGVERDFLLPTLQQLKEIFVLLGDKEYLHSIDSEEKKQSSIYKTQEEENTNLLTKETQRIFELEGELKVYKNALAEILSCVEDQVLAGGRKRYLLRAEENMLINWKSLVI